MYTEAANNGKYLVTDVNETGAGAIILAAIKRKDKYVRKPTGCSDAVYEIRSSILGLTSFKF